MSQPEEQGHYARKQMGCGMGLISWSHRRRFETGLKLVSVFKGGRLLDYGSGDGTFLSMLAKAVDHPGEMVGSEIDERLVAECNGRFKAVDGLRFVHSTELRADAFSNHFDTLVCMEVLEHVTDVDAHLVRFARWLAPGGTLLISVPVEIGLPLLVKQSARCVAGWMGLGDYPGTTPYTWGQLARSVMAGADQHMERPVHKDPGGLSSHDHKGFNWRLLREKVRRGFQLEETVYSPINCLGPQLASQVWMIARKRQ
ncbi:MAG TPA: class I SAM-dependent methyltransferase [Roseimicrobium sp.]|nr:class I SAM-dependent methyltransferase [Roseimicrobium sp.]